MNMTGLFEECYSISRSKGFWDAENKLDARVAVCEKLLLVHCEISEAIEELRITDNVSAPGFREELADIMIRMGDLIGWLDEKTDYNHNMEETILRKMQKNKDRPKKHGKAF